MNVELTKEAAKKYIQSILENKVATLGKTFSLEIVKRDENDQYSFAEKINDNQFKYYYSSRWYLCFTGLFVFFAIFTASIAGILPVESAQSNHWVTTYNWQNIVIFLVVIPIVSAIIFGYIGSKSSIYQIIDLIDVTRWDIYQDHENIIGIFYRDGNLEIKSFKNESDHLAAEISNELSKVFDTNNITLAISDKSMLNTKTKNFCEYCGAANPEDTYKCQTCGANIKK